MLCKNNSLIKKNFYLSFFIFIVIFVIPTSARAEVIDLEVKEVKYEIYSIAKNLGQISKNFHNKNQGQVLGAHHNLPSFTRSLNLGSKGQDVKNLQIFLNHQGFQLTQDSTRGGYPGKETDYYGALTKQAVAKYQAVHNITPSLGSFGPKTRAHVNQMVSSLEAIEGLLEELLSLIQSLLALGVNLSPEIQASLDVLEQQYPNIFSDVTLEPEEIEEEPLIEPELEEEVSVFYDLTISFSGQGNGLVLSASSGISCESDEVECYESLEENSSVNLIAVPDADSVFAGWGGDCSGTGQNCILNIASSDKNIIAQFDPASVVEDGVFNAEDYQSENSVFMINTFNASWWLGSNGVEILIDRLNDGYDAGIRRFLMNGPYFTGTPAINGYIPEERWQEMEELLAPWLEERPDVYLGPYLRTRGNPASWPVVLYENWDEVVTPWLDLGMKNIGVDASQNKPETAGFFASVQDSNPDLFLLGEAHGIFTAPFPTIAIPRWFWNRYFKNGDGAPLQENNDRYAWITGHNVTVDGEDMTVWEAMGITKNELVQYFKDKGYIIVSGDLDDL